MIEASDFLDAAKGVGINFFAGVPCSFLTPLMNAVISDPQSNYVGAASEGEAVAIAAGAWLAGRDTVVMCQNSGLGNAVNPVTSLNHPFEIPSLLVTTWRGQPGIKDEPQHDLMGQVTPALLDLIGAVRIAFPEERDEIGPAFQHVMREMRDNNRVAAMILPKGVIASAPLSEPEPQVRARVAVEDMDASGPLQNRMDVMKVLLAGMPDSAGVIATTGHTGRELFTLGDSARNLYCVGSMGGASAIGLGAALNSPREIMVLDGDGAALMKLGNFSTIGAQAPATLTHVVLDNGAHLSTGGQATVSAHVNFAEIAASCGYRFAARTRSLSGARAALEAARAVPGPRFIHIDVAPEAVAGLGRPTIPPRDVARRFRAHLAGGGQ